MSNTTKIVAKASEKKSLNIATITIHATVLLDEDCLNINKSGFQEIAETIAEEFDEQVLQNSMDGITLQNIEVEVKN